MRARMTRSARKHKVTKKHALAAILNAGEPEECGDAWVYVGIDDRGIELEIVVVPDDRDTDGYAIRHAMPTSFRRSSGP